MMICISEDPQFQTWIADIVFDAFDLHTDIIGIDDPLSEFGITDYDYDILADELQDATGLPIQWTDIQDCGTLEKLFEKVAEIGNQHWGSDVS